MTAGATGIGTWTGAGVATGLETGAGVATGIGRLGRVTGSWWVIASVATKPVVRMAVNATVRQSMWFSQANFLDGAKNSRGKVVSNLGRVSEGMRFIIMRGMG